MEINWMSIACANALLLLAGPLEVKETVSATCMSENGGDSHPENGSNAFNGTANS